MEDNRNARFLVQVEIAFSSPWKLVVEYAHRRVTRVDRATVYSLEQDGIQDSVTYDDRKDKDKDEKPRHKAYTPGDQ